MLSDRNNRSKYLPLYDNGKLYARQKSPHLISYSSSLQHIPYAVHLLSLLNPFKKYLGGWPTKIFPLSEYRKRAIISRIISQIISCGYNQEWLILDNLCSK